MSLNDYVKRSINTLKEDVDRLSEELSFSEDARELLKKLVKDLILTATTISTRRN